MNKEADHFVGKDLEVKKIYKRLVDQLLQFGFLRIEPKKTGITLVNHEPFANVIVRPSYINLEFDLNHVLKDYDRFTKVQKISDTTYRHTIQLQEEEDLNEEVVGWIKEAYLLNG